VAELTLPENKLDREQFKFDLRSVSIPKLIKIIRHSHLTIVGSEVRSEKVDISKTQFQSPEYEPLLITGTIDLLLKNETGHYVILDFKWAGSTGRELREAQIKKGEDYQLALYRKLAETGTNTIPKGDVDAQGFFMLRTGELLTAYPAFRDGSGEVKVVPPGKNQKSYEETLEDIFSKYTDTVRAFKSGKVSAGNLKDPYLNYKVLKGKLN
jgi:RecB family exonuclease